MAGDLMPVTDIAQKAWEKRVREIYRDTVRRAGPSGIHRDAAICIAQAKIRAEIESGALVVPTIALVEYLIGAAAEKVTEDIES